MSRFWKPRLGAVYLGDGRCRFRVWAWVRVLDSAAVFALRTEPMTNR